MLPDEELVAQVARSGVKIIPIMIGAIVASVAAILMRHGLSTTGATDPILYGGADTLGGVLGVLISVFFRKIRRSSTLQAALTALLYVVALYGYFLTLGATWYVSMVFCAISIILISVMLGAMCENA